MLDSQPFLDFVSASQAVLAYLHKRLGFDLWMVTRTEKKDWIVLQTEDHGYGVKEGTVFKWADSFCSQMVLGRGPRIAPRSDEVPAYAEAPIGKQVIIGAYVGVPLMGQDGSLFGTLCAIHPAPQPPIVVSELPLVELLARLLISILISDLKMAEHARHAERTQAQAMTDALTGLFNRRAWDNLTAAEDERCNRFGHPACVLMVDLDGLKHVNDTKGHGEGDDLLRSAAQAIQSAVRSPDAVARLGGDEFAVLGVECDAAGAREMFQRVDRALSAAGIQASLGLAVRDHRLGLAHAVQTADQAMYANKKERRAGRGD